MRWMFGPLMEFRGRWYAGAYAPGDGCELWRTADGQQWDAVVGPHAVTPSGFGSPDNEQVTRLLVVGDWLLAGTWNTAQGAQLWRSRDGDHWEAVVGGTSSIPNGFGNTDTGIIALALFRDLLFAGTGSHEAGQAELWVSRDQGLIWEPLAGERIALHLALGRESSYLQDFMVFQDALYVSVGNPELGAEIWRTRDGRTWEAVVGAPSGYAAGLTNPHWDKIFSLDVFNDALYAAVSSSTTEAAGVLWRSRDGTAWEVVAGEGTFGDSTHYGVSNVKAIGRRLMLSTTPHAGQAPEIWMSEDGQHWQPLAGSTAETPSGLTNPNNIGVAALGGFRGWLYLTTLNRVDGGQIWRYPLPVPETVDAPSR